jgi:hypothetical protein
MIGVRLGAAEGQLVEVRVCLRAFSNGLPTRCSESYLDVANTKTRRHKAVTKTSHGCPQITQIDADSIAHPK